MLPQLHGENISVHQAVYMYKSAIIFQPQTAAHFLVAVIPGNMDHTQHSSYKPLSQKKFALSINC